MATEAELAAYRIMFRQVAPNLKTAFLKASEVIMDDAYNLVMILYHKKGGNLDDPNDSAWFFKSKDKTNVKRLAPPPNAPLDPQYADELASFFPMLKQLVSEFAEEWNLTSYDVCLVLQLDPKYKIKQEANLNAENLLVKCITASGITPRLEKQIN